jgi:predicted RNA-binding Zn-ribbon protein involved in translation (DUF1610 family)
MSEKYADDLLKEGILHYKSKENDLARRFFERALVAAGDLQTQVQAYYYLSLIVDDPRLKREYLEETLAIDMGHPGARRALAILDGRLSPSEIVDPDRLPAPVPGTQGVQASRFTCPKCGGRMFYDPDGTSLVCENCNLPQGLDTSIPSAEQDFIVAMANGKGFRKTISIKTFKCQGCGATFMLLPSELTVVCAWCGSVHVIAVDKARELVPPDAVIPIAVSQKQAVLHLWQWLVKKRIRPQGTIDLPRGLYLPCWVFDLIGSLSWSGKESRNKTEVPIFSQSPAQFNDVGVPGSPILGSLFPELLPEYNLATAPAYDPRFLAGWPAQVYETTMADAALEARRLSVERIRRDIRAAHGNVTDLRYNTSTISVTAYRLVLLPVWVADYSFENRSHRAVINGQTGNVHGKIPRHVLKGLLEGLLGVKNS